MSIERPKRGRRSRGVHEIVHDESNGSRNRNWCWKKDCKLQSDFRTQLLKVYESVVPATGFIWCPILHEYAVEESMTAAHIFSYKHGQSAMDSIFGNTSKGLLA